MPPLLSPLKMTDKLTTGVELIDRQHEEYFKRANQVLKSCSSKELFNSELVDETLLFLWRYVVEHFGAEEEIMEKMDYDFASEHHKEHQSFRDNLNEIRHEISLNGIQKNTMQDLTYFLRDWFLKHIVVFDKAFASFIKKHETNDHKFSDTLKFITRRFFPE